VSELRENIYLPNLFVDARNGVCQPISGVALLRVGGEGMKPETYRLKTDWAVDNLRVCQSCCYFKEIDESWFESWFKSCTHPDHYWEGTDMDGPEWNGFCNQWGDSE
jgi:hypothetical protein